MVSFALMKHEEEGFLMMFNAAHAGQMDCCGFVFQVYSAFRVYYYVHISLYVGFLTHRKNRYSLSGNRHELRIYHHSTRKITMRRVATGHARALGSGY